VIAERRAALGDLRVLDLTREIAGPYCTKLLADYGATVVKVEPPSGEGGRRRGPFPGLRPDAETSGLFLHLNTNKLGVTLDLGTGSGRRLLLALALQADLLVEDLPAGGLEAAGLGAAALRAVNPGLVVVSVSSYGRMGPHRAFAATELTAFAGAGPMIQHGELEREPLKFGGHQAQYFGGGAAAAAALTAWRAARREGRGDWVDVAIQESAMPMYASEVERQAYSGSQPLTVVPRRPYYRQVAGYPSGVRFCRDGYILTFGDVSPRSTGRLASLLGMPELRDDPRFNTPLALAQHTDEMEAILAPWLLDHDRVELRDRAQANRLPWSIPNTVDELLTDPQFADRGFFVRILHARVGALTYPGAPFRLPETPWRVRGAAPLLGEHNAAIYSGWLGLSHGALARLREAGVV
jgi:crotonobetainyl-CoA:carnitine CoA-transferase CaiB-like acyl-CoA transferase